MSTLKRWAARYKCLYDKAVGCRARMKRPFDVRACILRLLGVRACMLVLLGICAYI